MGTQTLLTECVDRLKQRATETTAANGLDAELWQRYVQSPELPEICEVLGEATAAAPAAPPGASPGRKGSSDKARLIHVAGKKDEPDAAATDAASDSSARKGSFEPVAGNKLLESDEGGAVRF